MVNIPTLLSFLSGALLPFQPYPLDPGFPIQLVAQLAESLPKHSWEYGAASEALLELYNPEFTVFGPKPFPVPKVRNVSEVLGLEYARQKVVFGTSYSSFSKGNGAAGDPSSLGVSAVVISNAKAGAGSPNEGVDVERFGTAADDTVKGLFEDVPRFANGAISHRASVAELWADWMYMVPPFLAYYAVHKNDTELLQATVQQIQLYREVLQASNSTLNGTWHHIIGPESEDTGLWSTGNAWAAAGLTRVLATILKTNDETITFTHDQLVWRHTAIEQLTGYIKEIVDGAMGAPRDGGLLRNYLDNEKNEDRTGYGEISGTSLFSATVYRMAVLRPSVFAVPKYLVWADGLRKTIAGTDAEGNKYVTEEGVARPAVNPLWWKDTNPFLTGSPEGQSFVVMMYAAWRDCVKSARCSLEIVGIEKKRSVYRRHLAHLIR